MLPLEEAEARAIRAGLGNPIEFPGQLIRLMADREPRKIFDHHARGRAHYLLRDLRRAGYLVVEALSGKHPTVYFPTWSEKPEDPHYLPATQREGLYKHERYILAPGESPPPGLTAGGREHSQNIQGAVRAAAVAACWEHIPSEFQSEALREWINRHAPGAVAATSGAASTTPSMAGDLSSPAGELEKHVRRKDLERDYEFWDEWHSNPRSFPNTFRVLVASDGEGPIKPAGTKGYLPSEIRSATAKVFAGRVTFRRRGTTDRVAEGSPGRPRKAKDM